MKIIARIYTEFSSKFGIPRQSGLAENIGKIVFESEYRDREAIKGLEEYSHLWLLWEFSDQKREKWKPTVRPPRLGGNKRVGVFATRSPFRPNPIGLSSVKLHKIEYTKEGPVIYVIGPDLMNGTPIFDIKPYLPYVDAHVDAKGGFAEEKKEYCLEVEIPEHFDAILSEEKKKVLIQLLEQDPRPSYQSDPERVYGMEFSELEVRFTVKDMKLQVLEIIHIKL